ncbi:hypothetical protein [Permianibacter aggregans]|uniref:Uncharacterized protein n=1 Tax=Permianibacter aggregans TaxID=1510150 RepID=A0A4V3D6C5_9GAMM|nr:hypothetical protein [Permianibacter aggregans]QGX40698.1 hypothetical protein E2H98_13920 [Permianibacter aggregans]TDQ43397.1 hypothetical protein EV696_13013 [Permianibacter aggregans]
MTATALSPNRIVPLALSLLFSQCGFPETSHSYFLSVHQLASELDIGNQNESYRETRWRIGAGEQQTPRWQFQHDYRIFELPSVDGVVAASNGHLHALSWQWHFALENWQVTLTPTLATSSNALRHLKEVELDDWQANFALLYPYKHMKFGIAAGSQFGRYRPHPVWQWHLHHNDWSVTLGFPENAVRWSLNEFWQWHLRLFPDGGQWRVRDEQLTITSDLEQRRWRLELGLTWQWENIEIGGHIIRHMEQRWRYRLMDNRINEIDIPDSTALAVEFNWGF